MPSSLWAATFISIRCVVAKTRALFFFNSFNMAQASAAPSSGSVPVPISSISTSVAESALLTNSIILERWAVNVERLSSMDIYWDNVISLPFLQCGMEEQRVPCFNKVQNIFFVNPWRKHPELPGCHCNAIKHIKADHNPEIRFNPVSRLSYHGSEPP